jgi:hypothetical protein
MKFKAFFAVASNLRESKQIHLRGFFQELEGVEVKLEIFEEFL